MQPPSRVKLLNKCIYDHVLSRAGLLHIPCLFEKYFSLCAILDLSASPQGIHINQGLSLSMAERDLPFPEEGGKVRRLTEMMEEGHGVHPFGLETYVY